MGRLCFFVDFLKLQKGHFTYKKYKFNQNITKKNKLKQNGLIFKESNG